MNIKETKFEVEKCSILLIQLSGRASSAVFTAAQIRPGASWQLDNFLQPQGAFPPGFYLLREGWVHCQAPEAPLTRGMPTGPRAFLANSGRVWATALRPVPPKKRPCAIHARKVGCASNTEIPQYFADSVVGSHFGRPCWLRGGSGRVCLGSWIISFGLRGAFPPSFYSLQGGWVNRPGPEAPLIRGMLTGP